MVGIDTATHGALRPTRYITITNKGVTVKIFIGSCSEDHIGIGTLLTGPSYTHRDEEGYVLTCDDGEEVKCYDILEITPKLER